MSNYARVACKTCATRGCRLDNFNHRADDLAAVLAHREQLLAFLRLYDQLAEAGVVWSETDLWEIMRAMCAQDGHQVVATDEYGREAEAKPDSDRKPDSP